MISLILDPSISYPEGDEFFSPDERFPEYRFGPISTQKNDIYRAVRNCFVQAGLDAMHLGTPTWNPLGEYIQPGNKVFVLCNFAGERRPNEKLEDFQSRCTHGSVIRAVIDYILIAVGKNGIVNFGNAPVQYTQWEEVLEDTGADKVRDFYKAHEMPVEACDLRLMVTNATQLGVIKSVKRRAENLAVHVNLDSNSLLVELDQNPIHRYRVINYNPTRTDHFHSEGKHEYVVSRKILTSDVIFSIPKLKTHEKVGISCAMKGFVGTVGHKDSLPHHRYGPPRMGGDEYPDDRVGFLHAASAYHDWVYKISPDTRTGSLLHASSRILKKLIRRWNPEIEGAWWGNDTAWRMVLDLVRIATYCTEDGKLQDLPCRKHLALIDGVHGGEGKGPAYPTAVHAGVLMFGDNLPVVDTLCALLMGFNPEKIPMVSESTRLGDHPLWSGNLSDEKVIYNSRVSSIEEIRNSSPYHFKPNAGWKSVLSPLAEKSIEMVADH